MNSCQKKKNAVFEDFERMPLLNVAPISYVLVKANEPKLD